MKIPALSLHATSSATSRGPAAKTPQDEYLETMRQLAERTGNKAALEKIRAAQKQAEARRNRPIPTMDEGVRAGVASYLQGAGPVPPGFDAQHAGFLKSMGALHARGVQFVDHAMRPLDAVDAFATLVTRPDERDPSQQVYFKAYATTTLNLGGVPQTMAGVTTATVRAEYLAALDHYLEHAGQGRVLVGDDGKPYETAAAFMKEHADDFARFDPRVPYEGRFVTVDEWERLEQDRRRGEIERLAGHGAEGAPKVVDLGGEISIGGVVLRKRGEG